jgi:hypothetical protein
MATEPSDIDTDAWSSARVELLKLHHTLGLSAALSAELIGETSRNAVISKRRRLGLMGANPLQAARWAVNRACRAPATARLTGSFWRAPPDEALPREALPFMDAPPPPDADPKTLADRGDGECAWPLGPADAPGDYRTLFCCAPASPGQSYCPIHRARARADAPCPPLTLGRLPEKRF